MDKEAFKQGDWIVHRQHGVGQIKETEEKTIGTDVRKYFRVEIKGGIYWLLTENIPDYVRPVSSPNQFQKALKLIREAPQDMSENYKEREREVLLRLEDPTLETKSALIRDLHARRETEGMKLSALNERQLDELMTQFLREMVVVLEIETGDAEQKLSKALAKSISHPK